MIEKSDNLLLDAAEQTKQQEQQELEPATVAVTVPSSTDTQAFELAQRQAKLLASSDLVPKEFRNNVANCVIAMNMAKRMDMEPLVVMQSLNVIHGRPSFSAAFLIARFNLTGKYTSLTYHFNDDRSSCYAQTTELSTGEIISGEPVTWAMAEEEGWTKKTGSKWKTMPGQMMRYRAAVFLIRTTAPELTFGMTVSSEETEDMR